MVDGEFIISADELTELLRTTASAYQQHVPTLCSVILFGGITLGEFQPRFSDVDLAVVHKQDEPLPNRLPELVRDAIATLPLARESFLRPKHVRRSVLAVMRQETWQRWIAATLSEQVDGISQTAFPFTLCDTWMLHRHGITLAGEELIGEFPFRDAPPTTPGIELAQVMKYAEHFALGRPFTIGAGFELLSEVIYYGTTFTRAVYTLQTGQVIGRVAGARWYANTYPSPLGQFAQKLGALRCLTSPHDASLPNDAPWWLWRLFYHYVQAVFLYAKIDVALPQPILQPVAFADWLRACIDLKHWR